VKPLRGAGDLEIKSLSYPQKIALSYKILFVDLVCILVCRVSAGLINKGFSYHMGDTIDTEG